MHSLILALFALAVVPAVGRAQDPSLLRPVPPVTCVPDDERIEVLLLGSYHMANPGADIFNVAADDVLVPKRQAEIEDVVERLAEFRPTRVAVEADWGPSRRATAPIGRVGTSCPGARPSRSDFDSRGGWTCRRSMRST